MGALTASTKKPRATTGTLTATVNGNLDFNADTVAVVIHRSIDIHGIDDSNSLIRTIEMSLASDIKNGDYDFNKDEEKIHQLRVIASSGANLYVTFAGTVQVSFDRAKEHYKGKVTIEAEDIFGGGLIEVTGEFDLQGNARLSRHKK